MKRKPNFGLAIVGGLVGTPPMTVTVYLLATLIGVKMNFVDALATMLGGWKIGVGIRASGTLLLGHLVYGVSWVRWPEAPSRVCP